MGARDDGEGAELRLRFVRAESGEAEAVDGAHFSV